MLMKKGIVLILIAISIFLIFSLSSCPTDSRVEPESTPDVTMEPTPDGTPGPTDESTVAPTDEPTPVLTVAPTVVPTDEPTVAPTDVPTPDPTVAPTDAPTPDGTAGPTIEPTQQPNIVYDLNSSPGSEWKVGPTNCDWQWGTVSNVGPIGSVCYGTNISGNYGDNRTYAENYVQLGPLNLSGFAAATGFRLTFNAWFDLNTFFDRAQLQYSTNGTTFNVVTSTYVSGFPYDYPASNEWSPNPAVITPAWQSVIINLGDQGGMGLNGQTTVYFRWVLSSDESDNYPGFYIDNINIGY
jgi:hypothetical protein